MGELGMAEYITKEAAINAVENAPIELFQSEWEEIEEAINAAPTADVVPVVRCKDCKHLRVRNQKDIYAFCPKTGIVFWQFEKDTRTSFCSDGERMDGGAGNV